MAFKTHRIPIPDELWSLVVAATNRGGCPKTTNEVIGMAVANYLGVAVEDSIPRYGALTPTNQTTGGIAALFVETSGVYYGIPNVDPWDIQRDARSYGGPNPVVAHPPCKRWGRYWSGGPSAKIKRVKGDDSGCFAAALFSVRTFGGVIEHPEASHAWGWFGIEKPPKTGGWIKADNFGYTCCVEQGHYGHKARKATWLYVVGLKPEELPKLIWGEACGKIRLDDGFQSTQARREARAAGVGPSPKLSEEDRINTPMAFMDVLLAIAGMAKPLSSGF